MKIGLCSSKTLSNFNAWLRIVSRWGIETERPKGISSYQRVSRFGVDPYFLCSIMAASINNLQPYTAAEDAPPN
jgi:hypothetical protein